MRWKAGRLSRLVFLAGYFIFTLPSCSSSSDSAGVDEVVGEDEYGENGENYADASANEEEGNNSAEGEEGNYGNDEEGSDNSYSSNNESNEEVNVEEDELAEEGDDVNSALAEAGVNEEVPSLEEMNSSAPQNAGATDGAVASAPAMPAGPAGAIPEMGSKLPYVVRVGETLAKISTMIYGDAGKWQEMAELTSLENANRIRPGDVVYYRLSEQTLAFATAYEGTPRQSLTVQAGDSLSKIAEKVYGSSAEWKYVWRQNDISNPDVLTVGQEIVYLSPVALSKAYDALKNMSFAKLVEKSAFGKSILLAGSKVVKWNASQIQDSEFDTLSGFNQAREMFQVNGAHVGFSG